jgi:HPt (histidine-containing phosphotransfer) domain-containing protein
MCSTGIFAMTAPIDYAHLDKYVCGDRALLDEILTIFEEQAESWVDHLKPELSDEDWQHAAHSLKGASRGVGAWAVGDLAEKAESMVEGVGNRREFLDSLKESVNAAIEYARLLRDGKG